VILALKPLIAAGLVDIGNGIISDSKSGVSGAGKAPTAKTHYMAASDNLSAYGLWGHRHTGELLEQLGVAGEEMIFTPHLLPIPRGILSTIYLRFKSAQTKEVIADCYRSFYAESPIVRLYSEELPQIQYSVNTNYCDIGFQIAPDAERCIVVSCLDNLLKGAAGQAVQNLNVLMGWKEAEGLE
jgi:N-acetyl-gamma-glutamyl-phosphate reductase